MTVWFVFPPVQEAAFRAVYDGYAIRDRDNAFENEQVGTPQINAAGTLAFVGTTRLSPGRARDLEQSKPPWLDIFDFWPPPGGWEFPVPDVLQDVTPR